MASSHAAHSGRPSPQLQLLDTSRFSTMAKRWPGGPAQPVLHRWSRPAPPESLDFLAFLHRSAFPQHVLSVHLAPSQTGLLGSLERHVPDTSEAERQPATDNGVSLGPKGCSAMFAVLAAFAEPEPKKFGQ